MQSLTSFFMEEPEESADKTRRYIEKLSRILQSKDFAAKKRMTMAPGRAHSAAGSNRGGENIGKISIFSEFLRSSKKIPGAPAKYKSLSALRAQSAEGRRTGRVEVVPWRRDVGVSEKSAEEIRFELRQTNKIMWPVDSERWEVFETDTTVLNPNAYKRTVSLMQTVVNLQENADKNRKQVLREIAAVLNFCEFAGVKFNSLNNLLGHLCQFIDKYDFMMESAIDNQAFVAFCRQNGFDREPATLVFALVRKEIGGRAYLFVNDFMSLYKYLDKSLLEIHRWAAETKLLFPYTEEIFFRPPRAPQNTFKPVTIWLFNASPATNPSSPDAIRGYRLTVVKDLHDIRKLHAEIKKTWPHVVPFGGSVFGLFDAETKCKVTSYMQLKPNGKYVVSGALQPVWETLSAAIDGKQQMASERLVKALTAGETKDVRLNEQELSFCQDLYKRFDLDQDNQLSGGELMEIFNLLKTMKRISDDLDVTVLAQQAMGAFDVDSNDKMSFPEFCLLFDSLRKRWPENFKFADDQANAGSTGTLELKTSTVRNQNATGYGSQGGLLRLEESDLRRIFGMFDKDGGGSLDIDEVRTIAFQIGIPDFERDKYKGFILRTCRTVSSDLLRGKIEFSDFKSLLESLITCKVDRAYRKRILRQKITGNVNMVDVVNSANPHKRNV